MIQSEPFRSILVAGPNRHPVGRGLSLRRRQILPVLQLRCRCRNTAAELIQKIRYLPFRAGTISRLAAFIDGRIATLAADILNRVDELARRDRVFQFGICQRQSADVTDYLSARSGTVLILSFRHPDDHARRIAWQTFGIDHAEIARRLQITNTTALEHFDNGTLRRRKPIKAYTFGRHAALHRYTLFVSRLPHPLPLFWREVVGDVFVGLVPGLPGLPARIHKLFGDGARFHGGIANRHRGNLHLKIPNKLVDADLLREISRLLPQRIAGFHQTIP